jgi:hypothetical protein
VFVSPSNASAFFSLTLKVLNQLNLPPETLLSLSDETGDLERARKPWEILPPGHKIGTPEPLFRELVYVLLYCTQQLFFFFLNFHLYV